MLQIIVPMAGAGSRFAVAGYTDPKPLIPVHGVPMIKVVIDNLTPNCPHRFIFICQADQVANLFAEGKAECLGTWMRHRRAWWADGGRRVLRLCRQAPARL
ncbi:putative Lipopolysaccharide biosynthesis protein [Pseudomonas savastanoi]|nr:NTP transferase domain-containing protein [Pseudomonas amygdali]KPX04973.1 hypothetical protein ALO74_101297 [Pseudomonas syringae pv. cunninghamiae]RMV13566.1 putative Lipopolysaccharide biosynthesis protein [Pseudomonas savastanoi]